MKTQQRQKNSCCPQCQSTNIEFDQDYGFYKCNDCEEVWAYSGDDPDLDELDDNEDLN